MANNSTQAFLDPDYEHVYSCDCKENDLYFCSTTIVILIAILLATIVIWLRDIRKQTQRDLTQASQNEAPPSYCQAQHLDMREQSV